MTAARAHHTVRAMRMRICAAVFGIAAVAACGGGMGPPGDDTGDDTGDDDVPVGFQPFVSGDWTMPVNEEGYYCVRATATEEMYIRAFRPIAPIGTHHTALAIDAQGGPDGGFPCTAGDTGFQLLFGSGLGTEPYALPEGVAFKLEAGTQVLLNLHLYNSTDAPLTGRSGIEIERVAAADVVHEAETIYALDFNVVVPVGESSYAAQCQIDGDSTIVGLFPHMHRLGTHMKATAMRAGMEPMVVHDAPYSFGEQLNYEITPFDVKDDDIIQFECGFNNDTGATVVFGDSSDDEMCVLGMYRYPATGGASLCFN
jgi:hypothetical protein